jgi:hypothetical protein
VVVYLPDNRVLGGLVVLKCVSACTHIRCYVTYDTEKVSLNNPRQLGKEQDTNIQAKKIYCGGQEEARWGGKNYVHSRHQYERPMSWNYEVLFHKDAVRNVWFNPNHCKVVFPKSIMLDRESKRVCWERLFPVTWDADTPSWPTKYRKFPVFKQAIQQSSHRSINETILIIHQTPHLPRTHQSIHTSTHPTCNRRHKGILAPCCSGNFSRMLVMLVV